MAVSPDGTAGVLTRNGDAKVELVKVGGDNITSSAVSTSRRGPMRFP